MAGRADRCKCGASGKGVASMCGADFDNHGKPQAQALCASNANQSTLR
jgi:hypothetical protein